MLSKMKQYTNESQTAKLIELGFDKPKNERWVLDVENESTPSIQNIVKRLDYSIDELIELLPQYLEYKGGVTGIPIDYYALTIRQNVVMYCDPYMDWVEIQCDDHKELIDNLYDMVVRLKEEGEI
jgi:hypothetical protein